MKKNPLSTLFSSATQATDSTFMGWQSEESRNEAAPDRGTGHVLQDDEEKDRARDVEAEHDT
jgi:hypothetical protein